MPRLFLLLFIAASIAATCLAFWAFLTEASGVRGTFGAGLVIASSALLAAAGLVLAYAPPRRGLRVTLEVLVVLGLAGTFFAAWLLMAWWVVAAIGVAALAWVLHWLPASTPQPSLER